MRLNEKELLAFAEWLVRCGAEVVEPVSEYEFFRVIARGHTLCAYRRANGYQNWPEPLEALYSLYRGGKDHPRLGHAAPVKGMTGNRRARVLQLAKRDGWLCFYCNCELQPLNESERPGAKMPTVEELCARQIGGPKHIGNQALACYDCNNAAANASVVEKVLMRERMRRTDDGTEKGSYGAAAAGDEMPAPEDEDTENITEFCDSASEESHPIPA